MNLLVLGGVQVLTEIPIPHSGQITHILHLVGSPGCLRLQEELWHACVPGPLLIHQNDWNQLTLIQKVVECYAAIIYKPTGIYYYA